VFFNLVFHEGPQVITYRNPERKKIARSYSLPSELRVRNALNFFYKSSNDLVTYT
jgi:hypothetical protein